ncbi:MAG: hypothetical protein Q8L21_00970 [Candidatus Komeilibacteria bacterium]|nr:hypothetical protein [Candidatus Komeilibacteria bacterium]
MDIISHGLWGGLAFGRKSKKVFLAAALFGMLPDLFAFTITFLTRLSGGDFIREPIHQIPRFVYDLYNISHSLVIALPFLLAALLIWRKAGWIVAAWPLHILFDIVSHDLRFFPTPFVWPFNTPFFPGTAWSTPWVFFMNWGVLILLYISWRMLKPAKIEIKEELIEKN